MRHLDMDSGAYDSHLTYSKVGGAAATSDREACLKHSVDRRICTGERHN